MESSALVCTQYILLFYFLFIELHVYFTSFELTNYKSSLTWKAIKHKGKMLQTPAYRKINPCVLFIRIKSFFVILKCIHASKKKCKDIVQKLPITWGNPKQNFSWSYFAHYCNNKMKCAEKNFTHKRTFTQKEVKAIYLASIQTYSRHILAWGWWQISTVYLYLSFVKKFNLWENSQNASKKSLLCNQK